MHYRSLLLVCSAVFLGSCGSGPKVTVCIVDAPNGGLQCVAPDDRTFFVPLSDANNWVSMPGTDFRTLIEYCGLKSRDKALVMQRADKIEHLARSARHNFDIVGE